MSADSSGGFTNDRDWSGEFYGTAGPRALHRQSGELWQVHPGPQSHKNQLPKWSEIDGKYISPISLLLIHNGFDWNILAFLMGMVRMVYNDMYFIVIRLRNNEHI